MPIYGEAKTRDMIRGILPSSARRGARHDLANIKRKARRNLRQNLHTIAVDPEVWENAPEVWDYPDTDIRYAVRDRRDADNVSALQRWAPSQVQHLRLEDRLSYLKAKLPHNTIGRHAVTHVDHLKEFYVPEDHLPRRIYDGKAGYAYFRYHNESSVAVYEARLHTILEALGQHRRLNVLLKPTLYRVKRERGTDGKYVDVRYPEKGRPLYGFHDVSDCVTYHLADRERTAKFTTALDKIDG